MTFIDRFATIASILRRGERFATSNLFAESRLEFIKACVSKGVA